MSKTRITAAQAYLSALVAHRDAVRLLDIGLASAASNHAKVLRTKPEDLDDAIIQVATKEAYDVINFFKTDPEGYPEGRTAELAFKSCLKTAKSRYARGKCFLCKGPALPCAARHGMGRSCA